MNHSTPGQSRGKAGTAGNAWARLAGFAALIIVGGLLALWPLVLPASAEGARHVDVLTLDGEINPITARFVVRAIDQAGTDGAEALVIQMNTPGGLDTSMREINSAILNTELPVVVYVYPPGSRAASAGLFIAMAAPVAAMAPNTNIGSAHPVSVGGGAGGQPTQPDDTMTAKVTNDAVAYIRGLAARNGRNADWAEKAVRESVNVPHDEALSLHVVDLVASDLPALLKQIDGREVAVAHGTKTLHTIGAEQRIIEQGTLERFLQLISDPNIAYILITVGVYGLIYELASPGAIIPGVAGVVSLILAFFALGTLPVNYAGVALIFFGFALFVAEIVIAPGIGALAAGGVVSLLVGSLLLFSDAPAEYHLSLWIVGTVVVTSAAFFLILIRGVVRTYRRRPTTGEVGMIGRPGQARTELAPTGTVFAEGELWRARTAGASVAAGARVVIFALEGLTLVVRAEETAGSPPADVGRSSGSPPRGEG